MKIPQMIAAEVRRLFSTKMGVVALVALLTVPILYGGLYLWANQDPYGSLDNVPVGLVVSDSGAEINGTPRNLGDEVADELVDDGSFAWDEVSAQTATSGLDDGTYDFVVEIPSDFTASIASITADDPRPADLVLLTNDANNYLASTIGKSAISTIQKTVTEKVVAETGLAMLDALQEIRVNLVDAADGATQIVDGITTAQDGTVQLLDGSTVLADGTASLVDGASRLAGGADQVSSGAATLADGTSQLAAGAADLATGTQQVADGAASLSTGTAQLATGAADLATGTQQVSDGASRVSSGAAQVAAGTATFDAIATNLADHSAAVDGTLPQIRADVTEKLTALGLTSAQIDDVLARLDEVGTTVDDANTQVQNAKAQVDALDAGAHEVATGAAGVAAGAAQTATGAATLSTGAAQASTGAASLSTGATQAASGAATLSDSLAQAAAGAATLSAGATSLDSGAAGLLDGANRLDAGAGQLVTGLGSLEDGLVRLGDGATTLEDGLDDGSGQIPASTSETRQAQSDTLGTPVETTQDSGAQAENYGAGLAPFFAALAAWIGIYALFLIVKPISRRAVTALNSPLRVTIAGWATPTILGAVQVAGLFAVLSITLGFDFANPWGALGLLVLASATYTAIILALNVWLGSVGQFIGLVLMVLQLVTAGGTFPWQTLPGPLQALHHVLPMGYVVDAMRQIMYGGGGFDRIAGDLLVLLVWLVGAVLVAALGVARMTRNRTLRDLQPSLIG